MSPNPVPTPALVLPGAGRARRRQRGRAEPAARPPSFDADLLAAELAFREADDGAALDRLAAAWIGKVAAARRVFILGRNALGGWTVRAVSPGEGLDRSAEPITLVERSFATVADDGGTLVRRRGDAGLLIECPALSSGQSEREGLAAVERLFAAYAHARTALNGPWARTAGMLRPGRRWWPALGIVLLLCVPVRLTAIVPAKVMAANASIIAAPFEAVIRTVHVAPNQPVVVGDVLVTFDDTDIRSAVERAEGAEALAAATLARAERVAASDARARAELPVARAELALKAAEGEALRKRLERMTLRAPSDGIAIITAPEDWQGRAVRTGERILSVGNASDVVLSLSLGPGDGVSAESAASVRFFPDGDPLRSRSAALTHVAFEPITDPNGAVTREARAAFTDAEGVEIGQQGTAAVRGPTVPLFYSLVRRPLASLRQWWGW